MSMPSEITDIEHLIDVIETEIDDTMDYDWKPRDGARAVAKALVAAGAIRFEGDAQ
jgi:hypothetical protein